MRLRESTLTSCRLGAEFLEVLFDLLLSTGQVKLRRRIAGHTENGAHVGRCDVTKRIVDDLLRGVFQKPAHSAPISDEARGFEYRDRGFDVRQMFSFLEQNTWLALVGQYWDDDTRDKGRLAAKGFVL